MPTFTTSIRILAGLAILTVAACDSTGAGSSATPEPTAAVDLADTSWALVSIGGAPAVEGADAGLSFDSAGTVSGSTGCNRVTGSFALDGTALSFGPLATTRMACEEPLMNQETVVLEALTGVSGWSIDADGLLHLTGGTELVLEPAAS